MDTISNNHNVVDSSGNSLQDEAKQTLLNRLNYHKNYYTTQDYNELNAPSNGELTIFSLNINSLNKYCEELVTFLELLKFQPDILILQETRANVEHLLNLSFPDYNYIIKNPINNRCGGIALLINKNIKFIHKKDLEIELNNVENIIIELQLNKIKYTVSGIYKHPNVKSKDLLDVLIKQLKNVPMKDNTFVLAGDLNIDFKNKENNVDIFNYFNKLEFNSLYQLINAPTRITKTSNTIIDHIYMRVSQITDINVGILTHIMSDHLCTFLRINMHKIPRDITNRPEIRVINEKNIENFRIKINVVTQNFLIDPLKDVDDLWDEFIDKINTAFKNSFPLKKNLA